MRIDTDEPKVIASYADKERADSACDTLIRENTERNYIVVDEEKVNERGYLY